MALHEQLRDRLQGLVTQHKVVLFMKGTRTAPACGFSASVVEILDELLPVYETVNVLADPEVREGMKELSQWPTFPQLYVDGQFLGGADIVREMHAAGELRQAVGVTDQAPAPKITISAAARKAFEDAASGSEGEVLQIEVSPRFEYNLYFGPREKGLVELVVDGLPLAMTRSSARRADGLVIDFVQGPDGAGFKLTSPLEPPRVKALSPRELRAWIDEKKTHVLLDVRTERERDIASIDSAVALPHEEEVLEMDRDATLVFMCHHGVRSRAAADYFLSKGFKNVYNLTGGIEAWSTQVDPKVPRY